MTKALASANNYLTMIVQDEITPYKLNNGNLKFDEMQLIELPWPEEELLQLGNTPCRLRITLSYFVEPKTGALPIDVHGCTNAAKAGAKSGGATRL